MTNHLQSCAASHVGRVRENNEDAFFTSAMAKPARQLAWTGLLDGSTGWALVADGVGGHAAGEVASYLALEHLGPALHSCASDGDLRSAVAATNEEVVRSARRPDRHGMATTIAGIIFRDTSVIAFNVGDSRIYQLRRNRLLRLSEDHVLYGYMLTRCLGASAGTSAEPHILHVKPRIATRFLLCTDGVTDELDDEAIRAILTTADDPAAELIGAALDAGGRDNATAVVVDFQRTPRTAEPWYIPAERD
ncbi:MAG: PP2C family protein-serine/threonine phosphatase [Sphingomicrobium sp.]